MARLRRSSWNPCEELAKDRREHSTIRSLASSDRAAVPRVGRNTGSTLPELDAVQVRRFRVPYCEAAILELEEAGLRESIELLRELFQLDERAKAEVIGDRGSRVSSVPKRPSLRNDKRVLRLVIDGLRSAEVAGRTGNPSGQVAALMETAILFESESDDWLWIADRLYETSLVVGARIRNDDGYTLNAARHLYGRFLLKKMSDPEGALAHLERARAASEGNKGWRVARIAAMERETLHEACCALSYQALLFLSQSFREEDPELAVRAATRALERATNYGRDEAIASALHQLGTCQMSAGHARDALATLSKFLAIARRIADPEAICDAHAGLALARKALEDREGTVRHLEELRRCATRYDLPHRLAQAHYCTGEYLLNESRADLATPHLECAVAQFGSLGRRDETERARCAAAISKGQEVMEDYIDLLSRCEMGDKRAISRICDWKNARVSFWSKPLGGAISANGRRSNDESAE